MRWQGRWRFWRKWQLITKLLTYQMRWQRVPFGTGNFGEKLSTTYEIRWQRAPFKGGDFGENGRNDEQSLNS